jgi:hypothetical protein
MMPQNPPGKLRVVVVVVETSVAVPVTVVPLSVGAAVWGAATAAFGSVVPVVGVLGFP